MILPIYVDSYSGFKANEHPQRFTLDEQVYEIATIKLTLTQRTGLWQEPENVA